MLICLLYATPALSQEIEEVSFKIYIHRTELGFIDAISSDTTLWLDLPALTAALGLEFTFHTDSLYFSTCLPDAKHCFVIHADTLIQNGTLQNLHNRLIWRDNNRLYIQTDLLHKLSGLTLDINTKSLSVSILNGDSIPTILRKEQELKREIQFQKKLQAIHTKADTIPVRDFHWSSLGYSISPTISTNGTINFIASGNMTAELLKGAFYANYNYSGFSTYNRHLVTFRWDNRRINSSWLKQLSLVRTYSNLIMRTHGYSNGIYISNDLWNHSEKREYTFQGNTTPLTPVEIYTNGQLQEYIHSDSAGHYSTILPISPGDNKITAIAYDEYAIPMRHDATLFLPPDMQPEGKLSYKAAAGYIDDGNIYLNGNLAYGISDFLTLRFATENILYRNHLRSIAILGGSYAYRKTLRINTEYIPTVRWNAYISTNYREKISTSLFYEKYQKGQNKITYAPLQHLRFSLNSEIPLWYTNSLINLNIEHYKYEYASTFYTDLRWFLYLRRLTLSFSLATNAQNTIELARPVYGIQLGYYFRGKLYNELSYDYFSYFGQSRIRNRINYQSSNSFRFFIDTNYEFTFRHFNLSFGITWRLPTLEINTSTNVTRNFASTTTQASGSVLFYGKGIHTFTNRYIAGASLHVALFLDLNGNNQYDRGEQIMPNTKVLVNSVSECVRNKHGIFFLNIPADYMFRMVVPNQQFDDISWQVTPFERVLLLSGYQEKSIYVPIHIVSEVIGQVNCAERPVADLPIVITNTATGKEITVSTDDWGFYNYTGLTCGTYRIDIPEEVLSSRHLQTTTSALELQIPMSREGILIEGKDFILSPR